MESSHRANVLVTSCLKTPVDPHTKAPVALYERERALSYAAGQPPDYRNYEREGEYNSDSDSDRGDGEAQSGGEWGPALVRACRGPPGEHIDLWELCSSNQEYYRRLEELKRAHLHTMGQLERMYRNQLAIRAVGPAERRFGPELARDTAYTAKNKTPMLEQGGTAPGHDLRKAASAVELSRTAGGGLSDAWEEGVADQGAAWGEDQPLSPRDRIRTMWQDFAVGAPAPRDRASSRSSLRSQPEGGGGAGRGRGEGGEAERRAWRHRVTVPQPFRMTLREAERKGRNAKSRSEAELEDELLRRREAELSECRRTFRASPVPAHVYLPLYGELAARGEERRRRRRCRQGPPPQKPFGFLERERRKKEAREAQLRDLPRKEEEEEERRRTFRAKPVPRAVYDSTVSERMKEDLLYRAIKMHMRSQDLLRSASLPRSMLGSRARSREPAEEEARRSEADFRPRINGRVPDFDASYRRFQKQLLGGRDARPTTACEPFELRTASIAQRRERQRLEAERASPRPCATPSRPPTAGSSLCSSLSVSLELLPAKTTEAAKRRQEAVRRVLEERKRAEAEEESWRRRQKRRERRLQRVISKRAQANDPHTALSQAGRTKLKQFRKQDLQRRKEYREEMREIQERVKGRPLLLEQVTQTNAKRAAEKRYADKLRALGLSEELVHGMAPKREPGGAGDGQSSVSSAEESRGKEGPGADYYPDDYEELDGPEHSGEEKGEEEDNHDYDKDTEEDEKEEEDSDKAGQEVDEKDQ